VFTQNWRQVLQRESKNGEWNVLFYIFLSRLSRSVNCVDHEYVTILFNFLLLIVGVLCFESVNDWKLCAWRCMSFKSNGTGIALRMELEWMEYNATNVFMAAIFFSLTDFPQDIGKRSCCYWKKELPCNRYNGWKFSGFFPDYFQWGIRFITAILFVWGGFFSFWFQFSFTSKQPQFVNPSVKYCTPFPWAYTDIGIPISNTGLFTFFFFFLTGQFTSSI